MCLMISPCNPAIATCVEIPSSTLMKSACTCSNRLAAKLQQAQSASNAVNSALNTFGGEHCSLSGRSLVTNVFKERL